MVVQSEIVLILGSGPNAPEARDWPRGHFDRIVAINNAWRVRADWDDLIFPEDFPTDRRPEQVGAGQRLIEAADFVPAQNAYGGFVYAGGTMAFTAAYWALHALRPKVMAFLGCDMVYPKTGATHFYGTGTADPLRADVTLRDLGAKAARLELIAASEGCACVNLSRGPSVLPFERARPERLAARAGRAVREVDLAEVRAAEAALGYLVPSGRYWEVADLFDAGALAGLDAAWRRAWGLWRAETRAA
jgi:hypothetical protein